MWCFLFNLLDVRSIFICTDWCHSHSNLILVSYFLKLYNSCTSIMGVVHLSKWYSSLLRLGVRVLLLFVSPSFVLSFVPICVLCSAPAHDDVVNSCVLTFETKIKLESEWNQSMQINIECTSSKSNKTHRIFKCINKWTFYTLRQFWRTQNIWWPFDAETCRKDEK
jgi:hypothetical protein